MSRIIKYLPFVLAQSAWVGMLLMVPAAGALVGWLAGAVLLALYTIPYGSINGDYEHKCDAHDNPPG